MEEVSKKSLQSRFGRAPIWASKPNGSRLAGASDANPTVRAFSQEEERVIMQLAYHQEYVLR